jgi:hypothetical protein
MTIVPTFKTFQSYLWYAKALGRHWNRSATATAARLIVSRVRYRRGPGEFDTYRFATKPLVAWRSYVGAKELIAMQERVSPAQYRFLEEDKLAFATHCEKSGLATIPVIGVIATARSGRRDFGNYPVARSAGALSDILALHGDFDGFAKPLGAGQGYGGLNFAVRDGTVSTAGGTVPIRQFFDRCASSPYAGTGYLLQQRLRPHAALIPLMPGPGLGTVRVLTFLLPDGSIESPWAWLKMPAPGAECDNRRLGSLVSPIDVDTGTLRAAVGSTVDAPVMHELQRHPLSGAPISGVALPFWKEFRELVSRAVHAFQVLPALGWDVAITPDGPVLVEANWMFGSPEQLCGFGQANELRRLYAQLGREWS